MTITEVIVVPFKATKFKTCQLICYFRIGNSKDENEFESVIPTKGDSGTF